MEAVLQPLLDSPFLPEYVEKLGAALRSEAERRQRFRDELRDDQTGEFINGKVFMHSPAKARHVLVTENIARLLWSHVIKNELGQIFVEKALVEFPRNDYEPDILFFPPEKSRAITPDQMIFPIPDLIVEVLSPSTERNDRGVKAEDYARHGVREYWIVDADAKTVEQHFLENGKFPLAEKQSAGAMTSRVISGFSAPLGAFFDEQENLRALTAILV